MIQLFFRVVLVKYNFIVDYSIFLGGIFLQWFYDPPKPLPIINEEKRNMDTIFYLTFIVLVSRIFINITILRDRKLLENESMRLDNKRKMLENEEIELKNELLKKQLSE